MGQVRCASVDWFERVPEASPVIAVREVAEGKSLARCDDDFKCRHP